VFANNSIASRHDLSYTYLPLPFGDSCSKKTGQANWPR
jgi:hypothetical protein